MAVLASVGPGLWMAAMNARYRDFRYVVPFLVQFGVYVSPVGFSSTVVPDQWRLLYALNPMAGAIDGFRWALLPDPSPLYVPGFLLSWGVILVTLWLGVRRFRAVEATLADLI
jgi:lipopolysaccharide transport system permease protein